MEPITSLAYDSLLRSRSGQSHATLSIPTRLLQTDIHSFLGNEPINVWLSSSCECSHLKFQPITWLLLFDQIMADLEEAFNLVASKFGMQALNLHQQLAKLIERKKDIFINLPTGFGKSVIFQALPLVIDHVSSQLGHICVVVSPLLTLVDDQVEYLRGKGVTAASISSCTEEEATLIEKGKISVVFGSPEAWIQNERWKTMLGNSVYSKKLCALAIDKAHVIRQW